jgi:hypothetical protein
LASVWRPWSWKMLEIWVFCVGGYERVWCASVGFVSNVSVTLGCHHIILRSALHSGSATANGISFYLTVSALFLRRVLFASFSWLRCRLKLMLRRLSSGLRCWSILTIRLPAVSAGSSGYVGTGGGIGLASVWRPWSWKMLEIWVFCVGGYERVWCASVGRPVRNGAQDLAVPGHPRLAEGRSDYPRRQ